MKIDSILLTQLIQKVKSNAKEISFNNVIPGHELCSLLESSGFYLLTTQYEMIYDLV